MTQSGFVPPAYPYDRLAPLAVLAQEHEGGVVDLSIGTPCDPPAPSVLVAIAESGSERGYPPSVGAPFLREAAQGWMRRRLGIEIDSSDIAACVGTKEFVAGVPHWLRLRDPSRDTILYPAVSYPSYAMGATLAQCRAVAVQVDEKWRIDLSTIDPDDAKRALCLWVNTPGNPAGGLDDLEAVANWGRENDVIILSDECYAEFTWDGPRRSILAHGTQGLLAVHSVSKRSNLAGLRVGFYAGDSELVGYLSELRKHAGLMVPGPAQYGAAAALNDDDHVEVQIGRYRRRLERARHILSEAFGIKAEMPGGGLYLWFAAPDGDAWSFTERLAVEGGCLVTPGEFFGPDGVGYVRLAVVALDTRLDLVAHRLGVV